ncbi:MAG: demethoxyubiquinone hydroxylase (CLK1/Coq7/Cat5 family) [Gammaproteobacteria bacterium]|jgi:demethoxyubiquinone hydroxylase (CLK1/Coq7/Cat5 family)
MTDYRKRIEQLTDYLAKTDERIAAYEAAAASTDQPLSKHFSEKLELARTERGKLHEHIQKLRVDDATHWTTFEPVAGGLLHGLLTACDEIGGRIDSALNEITPGK